MNTQALYTNVQMGQVLIHQDEVYLAGRFADATPTGSDLHMQANNTLAAIEQLLTDAGSDKSKLLSATIYLQNPTSDFETIDRIWDQWLPEGAAPDRTMLKAERLTPDVLVEIAIVAAL